MSIYTEDDGVIKTKWIRSIIKMGNFNKGEHFQKGWPGKFCVRHFYNSYKLLIQTPNY